MTTKTWLLRLLDEARDKLTEKYAKGRIMRVDLDLQSQVIERAIKLVDGCPEEPER